MNAIFGDTWPEEWDVPASRLTMTNKHNGNMFIFRGVKDETQREQLKSITVPSGNIEYCWLEEATQLLPNDFDQIQARMRGELPPGHYYQTILSFNPVAATHWLKRRFFDRVDPNACTCHTTWRDNRFIDDAYKEYMLSMEEIDPDFARVYGRGEWGSKGGLILTNFQVRPVSVELDDYDALAMGHDFGFNHADALLLLGMKDGELYVIAEHYVHGMTNPEIIAAVEQVPLFAKAKRRRVFMVCDSAEPDRIAEWQRAGWRAFAVDKGKNKATSAAIDWLRSKRIHISEEAENTAAEAGEWAYTKDRTTGEYTDDPVPVNDDAMAALRYGSEPFRIAEARSSRPRFRG
jgi:phage terminase large subunit